MNEPLSAEAFVEDLADDIDGILGLGNDAAKPSEPVAKEVEVKTEDSNIDESNEDEYELYLPEDDDEEAGDEPSDDTKETDEESEEEEAEDTSEVHTVKIDGEDHEVSLDELKKGYGLQKTLTQKGQSLAEERKVLDAEAQAVAWAKQKPEARDLANEDRRS